MGNSIQAEGTVCVKLLKCSRVGTLEELEQVQDLDCHFIVLSSREHPVHPQAQLLLLAHPFLHPGAYSNPFILLLCSAVSLTGQ